jgi:ATP-dependent protease HslVU (ClpYQ) peptidase subunit
VTAIVAIATADGHCVLGGDSYCGDKSVVQLCADPKVFRVGELGIGICGYVRHELAFRDAFARFAAGHRKATERRLLRDLPKLLSDAFAGAIPDGEVEATDSDCVVTLGGSLYKVEQDFGIWRIRGHVAAIGIDRGPALAAAMALAPVPPRTTGEARDVALRALRVATALSHHTRPPYSTVIA